MPEAWHPWGDDYGFLTRPVGPEPAFPHGISLGELFRLDPLLADKIEAESETGCWIWTASTVASGHKKEALYGKLKRKYKMWLAHRWIWTLLVGPIPPGHDLHHRDCGETLCVNPHHCEPREHTEHAVAHNEEDRRRLALAA